MARPPSSAFVGVGANLGDPVRQVREALAALDRLPQTRVSARSSLYRCAPIGELDQPDFINAVALLETQLEPRALLAALLALEAAHGRVRGERNAARTLDLDLLLFGTLVLREPGLELPHPRMHERGFVLLPLSEISPEQHIPGHGTVRALLPSVAAQRVALIAGERERC